MLGEKLGELRGKVTGQRVLPADDSRPKVETVPQKLARLTQVAVLYEWEIDEHGNAHTPLWEWK